MNYKIDYSIFKLKKYFQPIGFVLLLNLVCSCVSTTKIEVLHPAVISLPGYIETIGVINRFVPRDSNDINNNSNSCAYGDEFSFNLETSDSCISSIFHYLKNSPRFKDIDITDELVRDGTSFFPPPMDSGFVQEACRNYHVDALAVLEGFITHSDMSTKMSSKQVPYQTSYMMNGRTYYQTQYRTEYYYTATLNLFYSVGFRLYGSNGDAIDKYRIDRDYTTAKTSTYSPDNALDRLPNRKQVVQMISSDIGNEYSRRISPMYELEKRHYYTSPTKKLSAAHDSVTNKNWFAAKNIWMDIYLKGKKSQKGIAAFNIALANEVEGDIDLAMRWANEAKNDFEKRKKWDHLKTANNYISILNSRLEVQEQLMQQMKR